MSADALGAARGGQAHGLAHGATRNARLDGLYRTCWNPLVAWLRKKYGSGLPSPEDVAQTAFAKLAGLNGFESVEHPKSYLYATAAHAAVDEIKRARTDQNLAEGEAIRSRMDVEEITPQRIYDGKERLMLIQSVFRQLTPKQREIIRRSRLLGQTYARISADLGWSEADISRQLAASLMALHAAVRQADIDARGAPPDRVRRREPRP